jgi:spermidine/putrescine transport system ATP-binding protein
MAEHALELKDVEKRFGTVAAVDRCSLAVARGEILALLGPSGCGKTTLLNLVAGFEDPDAGDIRLAGRSLLGVPANRRNMGMVFQQYALFPHMTVAANIAYGLEARTLPRDEIAKRVDENIALLHLDGLEKRYPAELSGGQRQRVTIARALVNRPAIVWADEPTGALDSETADEVMDVILRLNRENGQTFVFVTHDPRIGAMLDRVITMHDGVIV